MATTPYRGRRVGKKAIRSTIQSNSWNASKDSLIWGPFGGRNERGNSNPTDKTSGELWSDGACLTFLRRSPDMSYRKKEKTIYLSTLPSLSCVICPRPSKKFPVKEGRCRETSQGKCRFPRKHVKKSRLELNGNKTGNEWNRRRIEKWGRRGNL